jgi:hypothetical protein
MHVNISLEACFCCSVARTEQRHDWCMAAGLFVCAAVPGGSRMAAGAPLRGLLRGPWDRGGLVIWASVNILIAQIVSPTSTPWCGMAQRMSAPCMRRACRRPASRPPARSAPGGRLLCAPVNPTARNGLMMAEHLSQNHRRVDAVRCTAPAHRCLLHSNHSPPPSLTACRGTPSHATPSQGQGAGLRT